MKRICKKINADRWDFSEVSKNDNRKEHLSSSDKHWLLYWNFLSCIGVAVFFLIVIIINNIQMARQNERDVEEVMGMIAAYMTPATRDEYDDIAQSIRDDLVFSEYDKEIEDFIQYIPNTAEACRICMEGYTAQALLVCANTGQFYSLDLYGEGGSLDSGSGGIIMSFGYDEVSQTRLYISKDPGQQDGYVRIDRGRGIVSVYRMKNLFCDDCIRKILETVEHKLIGEFFIYGTEERKFYPIDGGTAVQIGDYSLKIEYRNSGYNIMINYVGE